MDEDAQILHKVIENRRRAGRGTSRRQQPTRTSATVTQEDETKPAANCQNILPPEVHVLLLKRPPIGLTSVPVHKYPMRWRQWVLIRSSDSASSGSSDYICDIPTRPPVRPWAVTRRSVHCHFVGTLSSVRSHRFFIAFCRRMKCRGNP